MEIESRFEIQELFFSQTDSHGIILEGNEVFRRVSEYDRSDLISRPHSLIRHPDMPRAVFRLLWSTIQSGEPIVAYVKNQSKHGAYYWVLACVFPIGEQFFSIRLKPSSKIFASIPSIYATMVEKEKAGGMDASTDYLLKTIGSIGFKSYTDFMTNALVEELISRAKQIEENALTLEKSPYQKVIQILSRLSVSFSDVLGQSGKAVGGVGELGSYSLNMLLLVNKLGQEAQALGAVVHGFQSMARGILGEAESLQRSVIKSQNIVTRSQLLVGLSSLSSEMLFQFKSENENYLDHPSTQSLMSIVKSYVTQVEKSVEEARQLLSSFVDVTESVSMQVQAMEVARITAKLELSRISGDAEALQTQVDLLQKVLTVLHDCTAKMVEGERQALGDFSNIAEEFRKAGREKIS